ncbi:MAG: methyltransferase domain-containing protein [Actinomycetota bacterium]
MLACPHCALALTLTDTGATCSNRHSFDRGRGGYLNLLVGGRLGATTTPGDTPDALAARRRFLTAGHYAPIAAALADAVGVPPGPVLDVGCGEGYYLAQLDVGEAYGLDVSKAAVQMAARAFPGTQFVVGTAYHLPVLDHSAGVVVSVFAPHPFPEFDRVLRTDGWWVTVTPGPNHLQELRPVLRDGSVDKVAERLERRAEPPMEAAQSRRLEFVLDLNAEAAHDLFLMTPIRWQAGARVDGPATVSVDLWVSSSRRP